MAALDGTVKPPTGRRLVAKLAEVMAEVGNVPKRGRNAHFQYDFVQESDLIDAVRPALAKRSIIMLPDVLDVEVIEGGKQPITRLRVRIRFLDGETGEELSFCVIADGQDGQDKGPYKGLTGAVKYGLMKALLIGTGDDPEHDRGGPRGDAKARPAAPTDDLEPLKARVHELAKQLDADPKPILQGARTRQALEQTIKNMDLALQSPPPQPMKKE